MSSRARVLRDGNIEIQTEDGDCLILNKDEARTFHNEIEYNLLSIFSDNQTGLESQIPIVVNDVSFSIEDAEQLSAILNVLLSNESGESIKRVNWLEEGY